MIDDNSKLMETSVAGLLKLTPAAIRFLLDRHMACPGCRLARFCSLRDAIDSYDLDETVFLSELVQLMTPNE